MRAEGGGYLIRSYTNYHYYQSQEMGTEGVRNLIRSSTKNYHHREMRTEGGRNLIRSSKNHNYHHLNLKREKEVEEI